jgi:hypothetical protein
MPDHCHICKYNINNIAKIWHNKHCGRGNSPMMCSKSYCNSGVAGAMHFRRLCNQRLNPRSNNGEPFTHSQVLLHMIRECSLLQQSGCPCMHQHGGRGMSGHTRLLPYTAIRMPSSAASTTQHYLNINKRSRQQYAKGSRVSDYATEQPAWNRHIKWAALGLAAKLFT